MNTYLVVISAPSGAGKTTLCQRLLADFPDLVLSISSTTRKPRGQEKHGVEYYFLDKVEFEQQIQQGRFIEWAKVHDNYYGTSKFVVESAEKRNLSVLLDIDVQGAAQLRNTYPEKCFSIFISPPDLKTLEERLRSRGTDSEETIQKRLENAKREMAESVKFNHTIINDSLDRAYSELSQLIQTHLKLKPKKGK